MHEARSRGVRAIKIYIIFFMSLLLEFISYVQHSVNAHCIILLGVEREPVSPVVAGSVVAQGVVRTALLVATAHHLLVVKNVVHHQVDREAALMQADVAAYRAVEHKAALALCLSRSRRYDAVALIVYGG